MTPRTVHVKSSFREEVTHLLLPVENLSFKNLTRRLRAEHGIPRRDVPEIFLFYIDNDGDHCRLKDDKSVRTAFLMFPDELRIIIQKPSKHKRLNAAFSRWLCAPFDFITRRIDLERKNRAFELHGEPYYDTGRHILRQLEKHSAPRIAKHIRTARRCAWNCGDVQKIHTVGDELKAEIVRLFDAALPFREHAFVQSEVLTMCCTRVRSSLRRAGVSIRTRSKVQKVIRDVCTHPTSIDILRREREGFLLANAQRQLPSRYCTEYPPSVRTFASLVQCGGDDVQVAYITACTTAERNVDCGRILSLQKRIERKFRRFVERHVNGHSLPLEGRVVLDFVAEIRRVLSTEHISRSTIADIATLVELMLIDNNVIDCVLLLKQNPGFFTRRLQGLGIYL